MPTRRRQIGHGPRFVVLGAGTIGRIIARDLYASHSRNHVVVADFQGDIARTVAAAFRSRRVEWAQADAGNPIALAAVLTGASVVINCTRHELNLKVMDAALRAGIHYLDLGGLFTWTGRQLRLSRVFADAGITAVIGMGCAPGLTNLMAVDAAAHLDRVESIRIRVGSVDHGSLPGDFTLPYSARTVIEELTLTSWKWSRGRFVESPARSGWERVTFPPPVGPQWVVATRHSEIATLPLRFRARGLRFADFKIGFDRAFVDEVIRRLRARWNVRDFEALVGVRNAVDDDEICRVVVRGQSPGRRERTTITMDCHARARPDWNATAGDIDTACPASIVAQMLATGTIARAGVFAPEDIVPTKPLFDALRQRGITMSSSTEK